jgi:hypothetical protein
VPESQFDERLLRRDWVHVAEEDTEDLMVLRPADWPVPASRPRFGLRLDSGARASVRTPGRGDAPETFSGSWRLVDGDQIELTLESGESQRLHIEHLERDRLVLKKS